jgi:hypothetical protein
MYIQGCIYRDVYTWMYIQGFIYRDVYTGMYIQGWGVYRGAL